MTYDEVAAIALGLAGTEEGMSYGTPSIKRKGRFMFRLKEDGEAVAIKMSWDDHDQFLAAHPEACFKTPHYEGYPAFLVRLDELDPELAQELVRASWEDAPKKAQSVKRS